MSSRKSRNLDAALALLFAAIVTAALAREASADAFDDARKVFKEGQAAYAAGKYGEAADRYQAAYQVMRSPLLFFNIAQARRLQFKQDGDYRNLVASRDQYERFIAEAKPGPDDRARAKENLQEVERISTDEAQKKFESARQAMRVGKFAAAIADYDASYQLSRRPAILFNLAQAHRKQFAVDGKLDHLGAAEAMLATYRKEAKDEVDPKTLDEILGEIRTQRAEYHRKREAESISREPAALRKARESYQQGDMDAALNALAEAEQQKDNSKPVMLQLYRLRGQAAALARQPSEAVDAFKYYLALEPAADGTGLREEAAPAFTDAKKFWSDKQPLRIDHLPPGRVPPGAKVSIQIRVSSDPLAMIRTRVLRYRRQGEKPWTELRLDTRTQAAQLPRAPQPIVGKQYRMEYFIVALDGNGAVLDSLGTETAPLAYLVTEDAIVRPPPVYKRWWFWAGIGAVAAGTIATIAIIQDDGLPDTPMVGDHSEGQ